MFDTYLDKEHPEFNPHENVCANCGAPIRFLKDGYFHEDAVPWASRRLCSRCWALHKAKIGDSGHSAPGKRCPFPWMGDRCSLNERGLCSGACALNSTYRAWEGLKWWITDYERCIQDHEAIIRLMEADGRES
ncbi:MAG: hypothetical protein ABIJ47_10870 [Candidatus Bathyarchaeota archaeon]